MFPCLFFSINLGWENILLKILKNSKLVQKNPLVNLLFTKLFSLYQTSICVSMQFLRKEKTFPFLKT